MLTLKETLMKKEDWTAEEALVAINECRDEMHERLKAGEIPYYILEEYFGLEPDWLDEIM